MRESLRRTIVEQIIEIGKRLIAAKRIAGDGRWLLWLRERQMSALSELADYA